MIEICSVCSASGVAGIRTDDNRTLCKHTIKTEYNSLLRTNGVIGDLLNATTEAIEETVSDAAYVLGLEEVAEAAGESEGHIMHGCQCYSGIRKPGYVCPMARLKTALEALAELEAATNE